MSILPLPKKGSQILKDLGISVDPITNKVEGGQHAKLKSRRRWYIPTRLVESEGWKSGLVRFAIIFGANVDENGDISIGFVKWLFLGLFFIAIGALIAYKLALAVYTANFIGLVIFGSVVGIGAGLVILGAKKAYVVTDGLSGSNVPVSIDDDEEDPEKRILVVPNERDFTNVEIIPLQKFNEMDFFGGQLTKTQWGEPVYSGDLQKGMAAFGSITPELGNHFIRKRFPAKDRVSDHHAYLLKNLTKLLSKHKITTDEAKDFADTLNRINEVYRAAEKVEYDLEEKYNVKPYYYKKTDRFMHAYMFQIDRYTESVLASLKGVRDNWPNLYKEYMDSTNMMRIAKYNLADINTRLSTIGSEKFLAGIGYFHAVTNSDPNALVMLNVSMFDRLQARFSNAVQTKEQADKEATQEGQ